MVAVKTGGGADPKTNFKLKTAIEKAKEIGFPKNNIERAIEKASGAGSDAHLQEVTYEGYLPGGVAVMVFTATDNTNRTYSDIRKIFDRSDGSIGKPGCAAYAFAKDNEGNFVPTMTVAVTDSEQIKNILKAVEAFEDNEDVIDVVANFDIDDNLISGDE